MKVVITGGAGFVGSHLCDRFVKEGHEVVCVDSLITGNLNNIEPLNSSDRFSFIKHDITKHIDIPGKVDAVLHFASPASPVDYLNYPIQTLKVGALGTHKALGLAKEKGAYFMLASTSEVYGDPLIHPQTEDYWGNVNPIGPRGVYDEAKRYAEAITMAYRNVHGIDTKIIRIFNTYGPRMRPNDGRAIPQFISQALTGQPITVYGDGSQTRSFCYVSDLVEGIYRFCGTTYHLPINLGNPNEMTILEMAETVKKEIGSDSRIVFEPLPQDDPMQRQPNISRAREILNWEPQVGLGQGLPSTIDWFRNQLN